MKKILIMLVALLIFSACTRTGENQNLNNLDNTNLNSDVKNTEQTNVETNNNNIKDFFSNIPKMPEYKVVYSVSDNFGNVGREQTLVFKGKNFKYVSKESSVYRVNDKTYMCITEEEPICYEFNQQNDMIKTDEDLRDNWQKYNVVELPSRTIAGVKARCFGYELSSTKTETCYSNEFVPLYQKVESAAGKTEMTAIEYSNKVSDSEFELPAEPQEFGINME
ncbi:MAG: hypothetical protein QW757_04420 [Candidatus Woesearchaeota archaeon]